MSYCLDNLDQSGMKNGIFARGPKSLRHMHAKIGLIQGFNSNVGMGILVPFGAPPPPHLCSQVTQSFATAQLGLLLLYRSTYFLKKFFKETNHICMRFL